MSLKEIPIFTRKRGKQETFYKTYQILKTLFWRKIASFSQYFITKKMTFELYKIHENVSVIYGISTFKFLYPMSGIDFNLFVKQAVFVFDFL